MELKPDQLTIKVSGERTAVLNALKRIEGIFPLHIESKIWDNDNGAGVHVFLTVLTQQEVVS